MLAICKSVAYLVEPAELVELADATSPGELVEAGDPGGLSKLGIREDYSPRMVRATPAGWLESPGWLAGGEVAGVPPG
jgi:hypothetical protein